MSHLNDYDKIANALTYIDAHDRGTWVKMGMAVKSELGEGGFELWRDWSVKASNYKEKDAIAKWKSFKPEGGTKIGTLFHEAKAGGWKSTEAYEKRSRAEELAIKVARAKAEKESAQQEKERHTLAAGEASKQWGSAIPALASHPYCKRKSIPPIGARQDKDGNLLIPLFDQSGKLASVQTISPCGKKKRFTTGSKVSGCSLTLKGKEDGRVLLCEGWATGCTLHKTLGSTVIVAFSAHNLASAAQKLDKELPYGHSITVCGDVDESGAGQKAAEAAARQINLHIHNSFLYFPSFTAEENEAWAARNNGDLPSDFNDYVAIGKTLNDSDFLAVSKGVL